MSSDYDYWLKQDIAKPIFADILWSRPENRAAAGKLLIVGGEGHAFAAPASAYTFAANAGVGVAHVLLPSSLRKTLGGVLENCDFAPSTSSGGFASEALAELLSGAGWAEGTLLAGDFGGNSETTILLEKFVDKHPGLLAMAGDSLEHLLPHPLQLLDRPQTIIATDLKHLQKLAMFASSIAPIYQRIDLLQLVESLHKFSADHQAVFITLVNTSVVVAHRGQVSSTNFAEASLPDLLQIATAASVFALQNPSKLFEAITVSLAENHG